MSGYIYCQKIGIDVLSSTYRAEQLLKIYLACRDCAHCGFVCKDRANYRIPCTPIPFPLLTVRSMFYHSPKIKINGVLSRTNVFSHFGLDSPSLLPLVEPLPKELFSLIDFLMSKFSSILLKPLMQDRYTYLIPPLLDSFLRDYYCSVFIHLAFKLSARFNESSIVCLPKRVGINDINPKVPKVVFCVRLQLVLTSGQRLKFISLLNSIRRWIPDKIVDYCETIRSIHY